MTFENCLFTSSNQYRYGFIGFNFTSSNCYLENIKIANNRFETSYASDDLLAVITLNGPSVSPITTLGSRLNNCVIENNFCNKNQLILISSPIDPNQVLIYDLIAASNTRIAHNTCGAINALVKQDIANNYGNYNSSFDLDKPTAGVNICNNTCHYIYSGSSDGNYMDNEGSNIKCISDINYGLNAGNLAITFNNVSFIHTGYRISTNSKITPTFIVSNNTFTAYNTAYLNPYFNVSSGNTILTGALIVDKIVGA